jgi:ATPase subunit of ABC transporter with duplicated ATPase domains
MHDEKVTYFAETDFRNQKTKFGIKAKDRTRHMYVIGKTGMGKSTLLENLAIQDIQNDEGIIFIDPHGSAAVKLLNRTCQSISIDDVIYFLPLPTQTFPVSFNVLEQVPKDKRNAVAAGLMNAFKKIWVDAWSARMEYLLNYSILALLGRAWHHPLGYQ